MSTDRPDAALPPMPDRRTGRPRPPQAPLETSWGRPDKAKREMPDRAKVPAPPEGKGPTLEWFQLSRVDRVLPGIYCALAVVVFLSIKDLGIGWMRVWWLWIFALICLPVYYLIMGRRSRISAGADWLAHGRDWVDIYRLAWVNVTKAWGSPGLELTDNQGRRVSTSLGEIQRNTALWDLVYNGILHSIHRGNATVNDLARTKLRLGEHSTP
jgi:hypothetical protein